MIKVLELFSGIGACSKALTNIGVEHEIVDAVEIDKYAIKSFNAIHGTNFEPQDITKYDKDIDVDLIMHGSPCQDFSNAGLGRGGDEGSGTRSSLMYETLHIVEKLKPKYVIWENVKGILSKKHKHNFDAYQDRMKELGYDNYYQVLNAKDYGVPQNRERVFTVSIRNDLNQEFEFPPTQVLEKKLKDILEPQVDEKYYLSDEQVSKIKMSPFNQARTRIQDGDVSQTLCARDWKDPKCVKVADLDIKGQDCIKRVYSPNGISPTLTTMGGGNREPKIIEGTYANRDARVHNEYSPALRSERSGLKVAEPFIAASRGRNPEGPSDRTPGAPTEQRLEPKYDGTTNTLTSVQKDRAKDGKGLSRNYPQGNRVYSTNGVNATLSSQGVGGVGGYSGNYRLPNHRIRKLTPLECWRLMGFSDEDFDKASKVNSNTQLYKQAGNSIVVNVLEAILSQLWG